MPTENSTGQRERHIDRTSVAHTNMVPPGSTVTVQPTLDLPTISQTTSAHNTQQTAPITPETPLNGMSAIRNSFRQYNVSKEVIEVLMASWRPGTKKQYSTYLNKWLEFCSKRTIDYSSPKISEAVEFLMALHSQGLRYSSINTARSALSSILKLDNCDNFGTHPLVTRFMKGIYELIKPKPKYNQIWDVSQVLDYLKTLYPLEKLSLKELTQKTVMLLLLVTGQRGQFIHLLSLNGIQLTSQTAYLSLEEHTKTSRPNKAAAAVTITEFTPDSRICPLTTLKAYIKETETLRNGENKLFISFIKPNKAVSRDTISRWTKQVLTSSGIDTKMFTSHSTRAASATKAHQKEIPLDTILNTIGWESAETFQKYYHKPVLGSRGATLAEAVLS